ncbi:hypothetical protein ACFX12_026516 [Malus domestica]
MASKSSLTPPPVLPELHVSNRETLLNSLHRHLSVSSRPPPRLRLPPRRRRAESL